MEVHFILQTHFNTNERKSEKGHGNKRKDKRPKRFIIYIVNNFQI